MSNEQNQSDNEAHSDHAVVMLACPFCGEVPEADLAEDTYGTWYEFSCSCGLSRSGVQICDLMSTDERINHEFIHGEYDLKYRERARKYCIERWNTRAT